MDRLRPACTYHFGRREWLRQSSIVAGSLAFSSSGAFAVSDDVRSHPAVISHEPGSAFSLFGDYIVGRQIELVPNQRIVQAWRVASWSPGVFSLARFELQDQGSATKLVFDHIGFPAGTAEHLAAGWHANYWEPLQKFLA